MKLEAQSSWQARIPEAGRRRNITPVLLACGIAAPAFYLVSDVVAGLHWESYSFRDQTISELNAYGSPSRTLTIILGLAGYTFLTLFGVGVWRAAPGKRALRVAGAAFTAMGLLSLWAVPFWSMHVRGAETTFSDSMHLIGGGLVGMLLLVAIVFGAASLGTRFRWYSLLTVVVLIIFLVWTAQAGSLADNPDTPWLGVKERFWVYAYQLWIVSFAVSLLLPRDAGQASGPTNP